MHALSYTYLYASPKVRRDCFAMPSITCSCRNLTRFGVEGTSRADGVVAPAAQDKENSATKYL